MLDWQPVKRIRLNLQARHNGSYFSDDYNTPSFRVAPSTTFDGRAEWLVRNLRLFVYGRNLFDKFYYRTLGFAVPPLTLPTLATLGEPRQLVVGVESRF